MAKDECWSYSAGVRKVNRVRVYERRDTPCLYIEWYPHGNRTQRSLVEETGQPVLNNPTGRAMAKGIADRMAARILKHAQAPEELADALPEEASSHRTLGELLARYHKVNEPEWGDSHASNCDRHRRWWLKVLGANTRLTAITPDRVREALRRELEAVGPEKLTASKRENRTRYLMAVYTYAVEEAKWLTPQHDLKGLRKYVRSLRTRGESRPYTKDEVERLLEAAEQNDLRVAVYAHLAWATGRRPKAIRALKADAYSTEAGEDGDEYGVIQFPAATDKARRSGRAYVYGRAKELTERLLATPAVQNSGVLFPSARYELSDPEATGRCSQRWLENRWVEEVEPEAGVEHMRGRGIYGVKRRFATEAVRQDAMAASKQAGVNPEMLRDRYFQDDDRPKQALAKHMAELVTED